MIKLCCHYAVISTSRIHLTTIYILNSINHSSGNEDLRGIYIFDRDTQGTLSQTLSGRSFISLLLTRNYQTEIYKYT